MFLHFGGLGWEITATILADVGYAYCNEPELSACSEGKWFVEQQMEDEVSFVSDVNMTALVTTCGLTDDSEDDNHNSEPPTAASQASTAQQIATYVLFIFMIFYVV